MDPWMASVARRLAAPKGQLEVRMGGGWPRLINNLKHSGDWPIKPAQARQLEIKHGLGDGQFGQWGFPYLFELIKHLDPVGGAAENIHNQFLFAIKPGLEHNDILPKAMFCEDFEIADGNRRCVVNHSITGLQTLLDDCPLLFIGAPRTLRFSDTIGVPRQSVLCIPDSSAINSYERIRDKVRRWLGRASTLKPNQKPVIAHSSASFGLTLLLDLGADFCLDAVDLGLAAAIFDTEYMSTRPWFQENAGAILETRARLAGELNATDEAGSILDPEKIRSFGSLWKKATEQFAADPEVAIGILTEAVALLSPREAPIAHASLELWKHVNGQECSLEKARLIAGITDKHEPDIIAAVLNWSSGAAGEATQHLECATAKSPFDPVAREVAELMVVEPSTEARRAVLNRLTIERRPFAGSRLSWSLWGDFPRAMNHDPLADYR